MGMWVRQTWLATLVFGATAAIVGTRLLAQGRSAIAPSIIAAILTPWPWLTWVCGRSAVARVGSPISDRIFRGAATGAAIQFAAQLLPLLGLFAWAQIRATHSSAIESSMNAIVVVFGIGLGLVGALPGIFIGAVVAIHRPREVVIHKTHHEVAR